MKAEEALQRIYEERPLIHHLTNYVTVNLVANTTLSIGALPVMAHALEEVVEMVSLASALVVNIGTLDPSFIEAALIAGHRANARGIPVVLDPVGAGATSFRTETAKRLLSELSIAAVCGNAGEIATLAGLTAEVRGVESLAGDPREAATKAARAVGTTVAATGKTDYVSDGECTVAISNGHPFMSRVVGSGCASTAVVGCFTAVGGAETETVAHALAYFGRAGEVAAKGAAGGGTFEPQLLDALAGDTKGLEDTLQVKEVSG
jgi:hydroxyethylthiazole kinase